MSYKHALTLLAFLFAGVGSGLQAQESPQALFDQANDLFEEGEIAEAAAMYRNIEERGFYSGALYLNLGIIAVQLDSMGLAKAYFLKAEDYPETEARAQQALRYVESQFSRQSARLPKLPWDKAVDWLNEVPGATGVLLTGFICFVSGLLILYLYWFGLIQTGNKAQWFSFSLLGIGLIIILTAFYVDYVDQRYDQGVLIADQSRVYQNPSEDANLVSIAYEGYDLTIDRKRSRQKPGWFYVRLSNGQFGWIQIRGIKVID